MARVPASRNRSGRGRQELLNRPISLNKALVNSPKAARARRVHPLWQRARSHLRELAVVVGWLARFRRCESSASHSGSDSNDDIQALINNCFLGKPVVLDALTLDVLKAAALRSLMAGR